MPASPEQSWLRRLPLRKLLALMTTLWALALCTVMVIANMDIAPGVAGILQVICGVAIGGYCGSSAWEAVKEAQKE